MQASFRPFGRAHCGRSNHRCVLSRASDTDRPDAQASVTLPILPFPQSQLMVPSMTKDLHLFEPRYLEMLHAVQSSASSSFVHVVVEESSAELAKHPGSLCTDGVAFCAPVLVKVMQMRELSVGAMVRVQAQERTAMQSIDIDRPYLQGNVVALPDVCNEDDRPQVLKQYAQVQGLIADVKLLSAKLPPTPEGAGLQRALQWVDSHQARQRRSMDDHDLLRAERLSWAALAEPPCATQMEKEELQERRLHAMGTTSTLLRLQSATEWLAVLRSSLAARAALASISSSPSVEDAS